MKMTPPKNLGIRSIDDFISSAQFIFKLENKKEINFILDLSKMQSICLLGQLLLYKFISYTVEHKCFIKPEINFGKDKKIINMLNNYGFYEIIMTYVNMPENEKNILKSYKKMKPIEKDNLLITPQRLLRSEDTTKDILESELFTKLRTFYEDKNVFTIVSLCVGELLSNFWAHATEDSGTVMVAYAKKESLQVCFADNGNGIISSLKHSNTNFSSLSDKKILQLAIEKGVTSKHKTDHMGIGLYLIKNICKYNNGELKIFSEGHNLNVTAKGDKVKECGYWKGTIIYLKINLNTIVNLHSMPELEISPRNNISWR